MSESAALLLSQATALDHDGLDLADFHEAASSVAETVEGYPSGSLVIVGADDQGSTVFEGPVGQLKDD